MIGLLFYSQLKGGLAICKLIVFFLLKGFNPYIYYFGLDLAKKLIWIGNLIDLNKLKKVNKTPATCLSIFMMDLAKDM